MSNEVYSLVKRRKVGSATLKSVLLYMADCASDDGTGIWASKANISRDLEIDKRTVQRAVDSLVKMGVLSEDGIRECKQGFTHQYVINLPAVESLETTRQTGGTEPPHPQDIAGGTEPPVAQDHPRGGTEPPLGVAQNHPNHPKNHPRTTSLSESREPELDVDPPEKVAVDAWNATAARVGWSQVQVISRQRTSAVLARLKDLGGLAGWEVALERAAASDFLTGQTDKPFMASFDWITKPANLTKLMEGNYDNRKPGQSKPIGRSRGGNADRLASALR